MYNGYIGRMVKLYKWEANNTSVLIKNLEHFDPLHTFDCGQCFRWSYEGGHWTGVVKGRVLDLEWNGRDLKLNHTTPEEFLELWSSYLDLERDYGAIKEKLSKNDPVMARAVAYGHGLRLLRQDFHEMLFSFQISQNNGIPRIRKIVESLSKSFGEPVDTARRLYSFPSIKKIASAGLQELKDIRAGYRDKYIHRAARQLDNGEIDIHVILKGGENAREELLKLFGVGEKVADCILLFSGIRYDAFPVDRWVKRVMAELYLGYEAGYDELNHFAKERFGELAGFAQQYLFYYARAHKIGLQPH